MTPRPPAELDITESLVRRLLTEQYPDLARHGLGPRAEGWDCVMMPLASAESSDLLAVRLPRRAAAVAGIMHEQRWLPELAGRLPLPVPAPLKIGAPSAQFPWPWSIVPWFTGDAASTTAPADRRGWARALADFVADLHQRAAGDAPANPYRGVPLAIRDAAVPLRIGNHPSSRHLLAVWNAALEAPPWAGPPVWLHGDLHPANLVVRGPEPELMAVIDFIDLTSGDPATDLATAWLTFDVEGRADFRSQVDARCAHPDETWARARGWALALASAMTQSADPVMAACAAHTFEEVLRD